MWVKLGVVLLVVGAAGFVLQCVKFVRVTLPENYGGNPGFGALETRVAPGFAIACLGLGLALGSWKWGLIVFGLGMFATGFVAMALARLFGGR